MSTHSSAPSHVAQLDVPAPASQSLAGLLLAAISATLVIFFGFINLYANAPIMLWAWRHWLPNLNQEHGKLVIPIALFLCWYHRARLRTAPKEGSHWGLLFLGAGFFFVLLGTRAQQPRLSLLALPFLVFGIVLFIWGKQVVRILAFPIAFLVFMIPVGALQQASFRLQFLITRVVEVVSALVGIKIFAVGTTLRAVNGKWGFDIAEGCSGIHSLVAIVMLTAIYAHIFEKQLWKKVVLLLLSIVFAIIANAGRIFTVIIIAKLGYPQFAGGEYHEYVGYISFPFALGGMLLCHKLLNLSRGKRANVSNEKNLATT